MTSKNSLRSWRRDELLYNNQHEISGGAERHEIGGRPVLLAQGSRFQGNFSHPRDLKNACKINKVLSLLINFINPCFYRRPPFLPPKTGMHPLFFFIEP